MELEFKISMQEMWRNMKPCPIWRNPKFLYMTKGKKLPLGAEILIGNKIHIFTGINEYVNYSQYSPLPQFQ